MDKGVTKTPGGVATNADPQGLDKSKGKGHAAPPGGAGGKVRPEDGTGTPETGTQPDQAQDSHPNQLR